MHRVRPSAAHAAAGYSRKRRLYAPSRRGRRPRSARAAPARVRLPPQRHGRGPRPVFAPRRYSRHLLPRRGAPRARRVLGRRDRLHGLFRHRHAAPRGEYRILPRAARVRIARRSQPRREHRQGASEPRRARRAARADGACAPSPPGRGAYFRRRAPALERPVSPGIIQ